MFRSYKIELRPNKEQLEYFLKCSGCMRFMYNLIHKANSFDVVNNITTNTEALNTANV